MIGERLRSGADEPGCGSRDEGKERDRREWADLLDLLLSLFRYFPVLFYYLLYSYSISSSSAVSLLLFFFLQSPAGVPGVLAIIMFATAAAAGRGK